MTKYYKISEELLTDSAIELGHSGRIDLQEKIIAILDAGPIMAESPEIDISDEAKNKSFRGSPQHVNSNENYDG